MYTMEIIQKKCLQFKITEVVITKNKYYTLFIILQVCGVIFPGFFSILTRIHVNLSLHEDRLASMYVCTRSLEKSPPRAHLGSQ